MVDVPPHVRCAHAPLVTDWEADPLGDHIDIIAYFYYTVTSIEDVCPTLSLAIGSAFAWLTQLELAGTLVFGGLLAAFCLLKPSKGHEGSNLMMLLKGAAQGPTTNVSLCVSQRF